MAIISVTQVADGYRSTQTGFKRDEARGFLVRVDSVADRPMVQFAVDPNTGLRIPQAGEVLDMAYPNVLVKDVSISSRAETGTVYHVIVSGSTLGASTQTGTSEDPKDEPAELEYDYETHGEPWYKDLDDKPIVNSATQRFEPYPETIKYEDTLTISVNLEHYDRYALDLWRGTCNDEEFCKEAATTVLFVGAKARYKAGDPYVRVTGIFKIKTAGWEYRSFLDQGYAELVDGNLRTIMTDGQQPVNSPVLLDGNGRKLSQGSQAVTVRFKEHYREDFTFLAQYFKLV